jgi:leucyl/phenylalanyl-tRNA--protein transferase
MKSITWLSPSDPPERFPPTERALDDPAGLLAAGGDLSTARLLAAYQRGIFPWYSEGQPVLWWSPDPRAVLMPEEFRLTRSLAKTLRNRGFTLTIDRNFQGVIDGCAAPGCCRKCGPRTWNCTVSGTPTALRPG